MFLRTRQDHNENASVLVSLIDKAAEPIDSLIPKDYLNTKTVTEDDQAAHGSRLRPKSCASGPLRMLSLSLTTGPPPLV